jgi:L-amino acid N-acyltransferase YncA
MKITITTMRVKDWDAVKRIYADGITTGNATFETEIPGWNAWNNGHLASCRFVAMREDEIVGWAALSRVSYRFVYVGVAEVSVYVARNAWGQGIGKTLLHALITESEAAGIWTLQAGIFPENEASIRLHTTCGFRIVGRRERLGQVQGVWRDVMLLERRSAAVGW